MISFRSTERLAIAEKMRECASPFKGTRCVYTKAQRAAKHEALGYLSAFRLLAPHITKRAKKTLDALETWVRNDFRK